MTMDDKDVIGQPRAQVIGDWLYDNRAWSIRWCMAQESIWVRAALAIPALLFTVMWFIVGGVLLIPIMLWLIVEGDHD